MKIVWREGRFACQGKAHKKGVLAVAEHWLPSYLPDLRWKLKPAFCNGRD
jgi:hypothetical protein